MNKKELQVSILSITYNHAPYIRECLDSLLQQETDFPFEIIIHDDCSTDGTTEIIQEYADKYPDIIIPLYEEENQYSKGVRGMFTTYCLPKARGKYIALCEGDDYWIDPFKLQKQVDFLERNPEYGMCYTKTRYFFQERGVFNNKTFGGPYTELKDLLLKPYCIPTATICVRKNLYEYALTNHIIKHRWPMGDFPLSLAVSLQSKIYFLNQETAVYRVLRDSACHFKTIEQDIRFLDSVYEVKRHFAKFSKSSVSEGEIEDSYNHDMWMRGITYHNYDVAHKYSKLCDPNELRFKILKVISSSKILFNLMLLIKK